MRLLSIGNSFSVDAQRWLNDIFESAGEKIYLGNLYIGGCPLDVHARNIRMDACAYDYYINNECVGLSSVKTALTDGKWDYVTLQQASGMSGLWETYEKNLEEVARYVRKCQPEAKILIHETWAYESTSAHAHFAFYEKDRALMEKRIFECYRRAADILNTQMLPVGEAVRLARASEMFDPLSGGEALSRDGFHLSWVAGRYLAGLVWYECLTGKDARKIDFIPSRKEFAGTDPVSGKAILKPLLREALTEEKALFLKECAHRAKEEYFK